MLLARANEILSSRREKSGLTPETLALLLNDGAQNTAAGLAVTPARAMGQTTVNACVSIMSGIIASLPIKVMDKTGGRLTPVGQHPGLDLLAVPNDWQTRFEFIRYLSLSSEIWGNFYGHKVRTGDGRVRRVLPMRGDQVEPSQNTNWDVIYSISRTNAHGATTKEEFSADKIFHIKGLGLDSFKGCSTIETHKEIIALALQVETHGASLFKNGAQLAKVLTHPGTLKEDAYERLKKSIQTKHGGAANAWKTLVLEEGMKLENVGMTASESQFIEVQKFLVGKIASIWGIPSFALNDSDKTTTWGSGLEQITSAFKKFSLAPRLQCITERFNRELLNDDERDKLCFMFDTRQFTAGEFSERISAYKSGIEASIFNPNEAREWEGMNPREGGDEYMMPLNMTTGKDNEAST